MMDPHRDWDDIKFINECNKFAIFHLKKMLHVNVTMDYQTEICSSTYRISPGHLVIFFTTNFSNLQKRAVK